MDTPERIWLIRIAEDEMIWANEPYPDGDESDEDIAEYRLASSAQAEIDEFKKALESMTAKYADLITAKHKGE